MFDYVKSSDDLDILIGKNNKNEWISIYRGLSRIVRISPGNDIENIKIDADMEYKFLASELSLDIYGDKPMTFNFKNDLGYLVEQIAANKKFIRYYDNKRKVIIRIIFLANTVFLVNQMTSLLFLIKKL